MLPDSIHEIWFAADFTFFANLGRLLSIVIYTIQFMALGSILAANIYSPPTCPSTCFALVSSRLFVCFYLAINLSQSLSKDFVASTGIYWLFEDETKITADKLSNLSISEGIVFIAFLVAQGFYFAFFPMAYGIVSLVVVLMTLCEDGFIAAFNMTIQCIYRFLVFLP